MARAKSKLDQWKWRIVEIGGIPTHRLIFQLEQEGFLVTDFAIGMAQRVVASSQKRSLQLGRCLISDLGIQRQSSDAQVNAVIIQQRGILCPPETGLYLRQQFTDQPVESYISIAMSPLYSGDYYARFRLGRHRVGRSFLAGSIELLSPSDEVVFVIS